MAHLFSQVTTFDDLEKRYLVGLEQTFRQRHLGSRDMRKLCRELLDAFSLSPVVVHWDQYVDHCQTQPEGRKTVRRVVRRVPYEQPKWAELLESKPLPGWEPVPVTVERRHLAFVYTGEEYMANPLSLSQAYERDRAKVVEGLAALTRRIGVYEQKLEQKLETLFGPLGVHTPPRLYCVYHETDEAVWRRLAARLQPLENSQHIRQVHGRAVSAQWLQAPLPLGLRHPAKILVLISPALLASDICGVPAFADVCSQVEKGMVQAASLIVRGHSFVDSVLWGVPWLRLDKKPLSAWPDPDSGLDDAAQLIANWIGS